MYDDSQKFDSECKVNIEEQGNDLNCKKIALDFINKTVKYKYSYNFKWMGRPIIQYPQDIVAMQEIIWDIKPDLIIETGVARGGSAVFYASMLELLGGGMVIGIDIDIREHNRLAIESHSMYKNIKLIEGSSIDKEVVAKVKQYIDDQRLQKVLVALDSNHSNEHVLNELNMYSQFVTKDSYLVVFDTVTEDLEASSGDSLWGKGNSPKTAVYEFLRNNDRFIIDKSIEDKLLITVAPSGYLKCIK